MDAERRFSDVLSEFARTLVTDFPLRAVLDQLLVQIVDLLPVSAAGVTLIGREAEAHQVAASDDMAMRVQRLQSELHEGPCIAAYETGEAVAVADLQSDTRFPQFAARARGKGFEAVFSFPLRNGNKNFGSLDLYQKSTGVLDVRAMAIAQTLANVAAAYLLNAQARNDLQGLTDQADERSLHDSLTGLPNRSLLLQSLAHAILRCRNSHTLIAVLYAGLDRFKDVNEMFGHRVGDELLGSVAQRLSELLLPGDTLAHLSGDEFVIVRGDLDDPGQAESLASQIGHALRQPFVLAGHEVQITASVGISFARRGHKSSEEILQNANAAMSQVKRKGGASHGFFDLREHRLSANRASLHRDLRGALLRGELHTEYQPIISTTNRRIVGAEALLRWAHPVFGAIEPQTVIRLAEESGAIGEIGLWVLQKACYERHRWHRFGHDTGFEISVNVSANQLTTPGFAATVADVLADTRMQPGLLTLEITEGVLIEDSERALGVLNELKDLGVTLALDDFGTGYSSLAYLKRFPVDTIKIDRVFIADLDREPTSRLIMGAVIGLAHALKMSVVAEGVETAVQADEVLALNCDFYQGFHFARSMSADNLTRWIEAAGIKEMSPR